VYFIPIVLRMLVKVWPTPYDASGEYCSRAYPLHVNLRFEDTGAFRRPRIGEEEVGEVRGQGRRVLVLTWTRKAPRPDGEHEEDVHWQTVYRRDPVASPLRERPCVRRVR